MPQINFDRADLAVLEAALGEFMEDAYGHDNEEGCFDAVAWGRLQSIAAKIAQARVTVNVRSLVGKRVRTSFWADDDSGRAASLLEWWTDDDGDERVALRIDGITGVHQTYATDVLGPLE
jgi:hypothetical protein